jgi:putative inorganic carbon (HCO3(-)) transporter
MLLRRQLPAGVLLAFGALLMAAAALAAHRQADEVDAFMRGVAVLAAGGLVVVAGLTRPAWTFSIALALSVFSSQWHEMGVPFSPDRLLMATGIAVVLWRELVVGAGARVRPRPIHWLLALVAFYAIVSAILAGTIGQRDAQFELLDRLGLLPFVLFAIAPVVFEDRRDRDVLLGVLTVVGAYLGLTALFETTGPKALVLPHYISDPALGIHADRARGPFLEAGANGLALLTCGVAAGIATIQERHRARLRTGAGLVTVLCALGMLMTLTRVVWLSGAIGLVVGLLLAKETRRYALPAAALGAILTVAAFAVVPGLHQKAVTREGDQYPLWDRKNSNAAAVRMIKARPLFGFGWSRFSQDSVEYYRQSPNYPLTTVPDLHNVVLSNAVALGLIGAALWAWAGIAAIGGAMLARVPRDARAWQIGLGVMAIGWAVSATSTPLGFPFPTMALWVVAGMVGGAALPARRMR